MILIREVADAPVIMGISKPAGLKSPCGEVKNVNPLFVGIDVSSRSNVAYLMKPDGSKHSSFSVQNNLGGAKQLSERIVSALSSMRLSDVVIGLEATSIYGNNLVYALREDGSLSRFQRKIHVLNPKQVQKFKEAYPALPKNDFVDAFVIADHLRFGRIAKEVYILVLARFTPPVLLLKLAIFTVSIPKPLSLSLPVLSGHSTSPVNLKRSTPG